MLRLGVLLLCGLMGLEGCQLASHTSPAEGCRIQTTATASRRALLTGRVSTSDMMGTVGIAGQMGALAMGYLLMNVFSTSAHLSGDVCSTLFGSTSILTLTKTEVWLCVIFSVLVVAVFLFFYHKIFAVTFDEHFARATGTRAGLYNLMISVIVAVIIVLAMNLVGSLLISALVIFPALSAMRVFRSFRSVTVCSAVLSVLCAFTGIVVSVLAGTPVGSTIVIIQIIVFFVFCFTGTVAGGIRK